MAIHTIRNIFIKLLPKGEFGRGVAYLVGGNGIAQALSFLVYPVISRLYTPSDFGVMSVFLSLLNWSRYLSTLKYETAITIASEDRKATDVAMLCFLLIFLTTLFTIIATICLSDSILSWAKVEVLKPYLWMLPTGLLLSSIYNILSVWATRYKYFNVTAKTNVFRTAVSMGAQVTFGFMKTGVVGLLLSFLLSSLSGLFSLFRAVWAREGKNIRLTSWRSILAAANDYRRFPIISLPQALLNGFVLFIIPIWLSSIYGPGVTGQFALCQKLYVAPITLLTGAISTVFFTSAAQLYRTEPSKLWSIYKATALKLFLVSFLPVTCIAIGGPWVTQTLFGEQWGEAGIYVRVLSPFFLTGFIVSPLCNTLNILERQDVLLMFDILRSILMATVFIASDKFSLTPLFCIELYSAVMTVCYIIWFIVTTTIVKKRSLVIPVVSNRIGTK